MTKEKKPIFKNTSVRLPVDLYNKLDEEASAIDRPINWLITKYIKDGLGYDT